MAGIVLMMKETTTALNKIPTTGYTSAAIEEVPDDVDVPIALTRVVPFQEISSFGIAEQKHCGAAIKHAIPQLKCLKLEISVCTCHQREETDLFCTRLDTLLKVEKMLAMKKSLFEGGHNGLQAHHVCTIQGYLHMLACNNCK